MGLIYRRVVLYITLDIPFLYLTSQRGRLDGPNEH